MNTHDKIELPTGAGRYTKKPVTIAAIQWTGGNLKEVINFTGLHPRFHEWFSCWDEYEEHVGMSGGIFKIFTLEGTMEATPGDWIIRGVKGEHYPCKPDIFAATYASEADRQRRGEDQQPFGYFRPEPFGWTDCAATDEGAIALYERPQARGEPVDESQRVYLHDEGYPEYLDGVQCQYVIERGKPYPHGDPVAFVYEKEDAERIVAALNNGPFGGELVDIRQEVIETLEMILAADWRKWEELASPDEFVRWAKSRANYALSIINDAPQPTEPVVHRCEDCPPVGYSTDVTRCEPCDRRSAPQPAEPVAYLDLGVGGYMDVGTDLTDEQLAALPKGRHMLGIIGTYGVNGYREAAPQPAEPVAILKELLGLYDQRIPLRERPALWEAARAALNVAPQPAESDPVLPYEQALAELIDKIAPGLDSGDILADAKTASAAVTASPQPAKPANLSDIPCTHPEGCIRCNWCGFRAKGHAAEPSDDDLEEFMARFADEMGYIRDDTHADCGRALLAHFGNAAHHRTEAQILAQTEELARLLMVEFYSREAPATLMFRNTDDPRGRHVWLMACRAQEILTGTDPENAAAELETAARQQG